MWAAGYAATKTRSFRVLRLSFLPKATPGIADMGEGCTGLGGVFDRGTHEEDDPVTWEALVLPP